MLHIVRHSSLISDKMHTTRSSPSHCSNLTNHLHLQIIHALQITCIHRSFKLHKSFTFTSCSSFTNHSHSQIVQHHRSFAFINPSSFTNHLNYTKHSCSHILSTLCSQIVQASPITHIHNPFVDTSFMFTNHSLFINLSCS